MSSDIKDSDSQLLSTKDGVECHVLSGCLTSTLLLREWAKFVSAKFKFDQILQFENFIGKRQKFWEVSVVHEDVFLVPSWACFQLFYSIQRLNIFVNIDLGV